MITSFQSIYISSSDLSPTLSVMILIALHLFSCSAYFPEKSNSINSFITTGVIKINAKPDVEGYSGITCFIGGRKQVLSLAPVCQTAHHD